MDKLKSLDMGVREYYTFMFTSDLMQGVLDRPKTAAHLLPAFSTFHQFFALFVDSRGK